MRCRVDRGMRPRAVAMALTSALVVLGAGAGASSALTVRATVARAPGLRGARVRPARSASSPVAWAGMNWGASRGSVTLDGSPGVPIVNPKTQTLYVPIQCGDPSTNDSCSATADNVVDVVSAAKCRPGSISGCAVIARATVGSSPLAGTIDERTDTIYTANATGTVSVINGGTCNAHTTSGCGTARGHDPGRGFSRGRRAGPGDAHAVRRGRQWSRIRAERRRVRRARQPPDAATR